jgi:hypothetical protein
MPSTDLVPCYYTGQSRAVERPVKYELRARLHELKKAKLGKFVDNGKVFLFFKAVKEAIRNLWDGPMGRGNLLPFAKAHNYGDKLHYEMPHAGDRSAIARSGMRRVNEGGKSVLVTRTKAISSRPIFNQPGIQWVSYLKRVSA